MVVGDEVVVWAPMLGSFHLKTGYLLEYQARYSGPAWLVHLHERVWDDHEWSFFEQYILTREQVTYLQLCQEDLEEE